MKAYGPIKWDDAKLAEYRIDKYIIQLSCFLKEEIKPIITSKNMNFLNSIKKIHVYEINKFKEIFNKKYIQTKGMVRNAYMSTKMDLHRLDLVI